MTELEQAISALFNDNINPALISKMSDREILHAFDIDDYGHYNRYMAYIAHKYGY